MAATSVVSRESVESWGADSRKLYLFRKAMEGMQAVSDDALMDERGYQWVAGVHAGFGAQPFCQHGNDNFVTWHRPYLLDFEMKLQAQIARIADQPTADEWRMPYWDWAAEDVQGLPEAFTAETYDDDGETRPNPLLSAPYQLGLPTGLSPSDATWRQPGSLEDLQALRVLVDDALAEPDFHDFSTALENPHNLLHGWVGGFMASYRSSFDPLFWVHHANIDQQFWQWQQDEGHMASIPGEVREFPCQPFDFKDISAKAFFITRVLGYTYSAERRLVLSSDAVAADQSGSPLAPLAFDFGKVPARFARARINVHGVRHPETTCELRFFANRTTSADASTAKTDDEHYLGSYMLLGHGPCPGAPGHCDPDQQTGTGLRPPHHLAPFDIFVYVTDGVQALVEDGETQLTGQLIVLDSEGTQIPTSTVSFDNASLTFR